MLAFINFEDLGFTEYVIKIYERTCAQGENINLRFEVDNNYCKFRDVLMGNDMWVWHDDDNGEDYVIMGSSRGSSFVRVTDPTNPEVLGVLWTQ